MESTGEQCYAEHAQDVWDWRSALRSTAVSKPLIVLKLDDVTRKGVQAGQAIASQWTNCVDFLRAEKVKGNLGVIGESLETDAQDYLDWIKNLHQTGEMEFWNHCYLISEPNQFCGTPLELQRDAIWRPQELARSKLGITFGAFGAHSSGVDKNTGRALASIPEIKVWLDGMSGTAAPQRCLNQKIGLEKSYEIQLDSVKQEFEAWGHREPYLVLSGHPKAWYPERFEKFVGVIRFLKDAGCRFATISEMLELGF
jgi:hypothetical protein